VYNSVQALESIWEWAEIVALNQTCNLLLSQNQYKRSALRQATKDGNLELAEKLWVCAKVKITPARLKNELFFKHDSRGISAWHTAIKKGTVKMLVKMWDWVTELQLNPEDTKNYVYLLKDKKGNTAWHMAALRGNVEVLERLWDWAKELQIIPEEIKNDVYLLKDKDGETAWHMAARCSKVEILERLWEWTKELQQIQTR